LLIPKARVELPKKRAPTIIKKVHDALNQGGAFIAIENVIDNERRKNTLRLLMSLNMLIENGTDSTTHTTFSVVS